MNSEGCDQPLRQRTPAAARRKAASAVEFALVSPVFFLLLAGIIEFGQAFRVQHSLSTAARQGARAAIVEGATVAAVTAKVSENCARTLGLRHQDISVSIGINGGSGGNLAAAPEGSEISVTVSVPYSKIGLVFFGKLISVPVISAVCTLERE